MSSTMMLNQQQNEDDDQHQADNSARTVPPAPATGESAHEEDDQQDEENGGKHGGGPRRMHITRNRCVRSAQGANRYPGQDYCFSAILARRFSKSTLGAMHPASCAAGLNGVSS